MRKKIVLLILLLIGLFPIMVGAETLREKQVDNPNELLIDDTAGVFTSEQMLELKEIMKPLLSNGNVVLKTVKSAGERNIHTVATEEYNKVFNEKTGLILLINIYNGSDAGNSSVHNYLTVETFGGYQLTETSEELYQENKSLLQAGNNFEVSKNIFTKISGQTKTTESTNVSTVDKVILEDDADLLTPEEEAKLIDVMSPLTEYGYIIFKSINVNDNTTQNYAHNYYYEHFGNDSGTMLLIDMDKRYIYICSAGNNYKVITQNKADIITDNIYQYASSKEYYECAAEAFSEIKTLLDGGKIAEPMRYASNVVISLVIGFLLTFIYIVSSMKVKRPSNKEITKGCEKYVALANIAGMATGTHKVYSPVSDSGSGSGFSGGGGGFSGGGGGGGGGFSGGGGGHSF